MIKKFEYFLYWIFILVCITSCFNDSSFNKDKIFRYEEKEILENKWEFFDNILTKSFFDNEKLIIINRATDKIKEIIENLIEKNPSDVQFKIN